MRMQVSMLAAVASVCLVAAPARAADLEPGDPAPVFQAATSDGTSFDLQSRKGQWTVLYFYPKAGTPGCTDQARGFRDGIQMIRDLGGDVFGISTDTVAQQAQFREAEQIGFTLLADPDGTVTRAYGAKMPLVTYARRWTFIIDPNLVIRQIDRDVDAAHDAEHAAAAIVRLKAEDANP